MEMLGAPEPGSVRRRASLFASLVVHALLLAFVDPIPDPPPKDNVLEVAFMRQGQPGPDGGAPAAAEEPTPEPRSEATPTPPSAVTPPAAPPMAPRGTRFAALARNGQGSTPRLSQPTPSQPTSFLDWQSSQHANAAYAPSMPVGGGSPDGEDLLTQRGRDKCEPPGARRSPEVLYLLFDSSGSMSSIRQAQALSCAAQMARYALEAGAQVVVANFARDVMFYPPSREIFDIQAALRGSTDRTATVLPARQLQQFFDQAPDATADLVIVSDGWFETPRDVLIWYEYFLEMNPDNRGMMFTVGSPGHRAAVGPLRSLGFDVYMYEQIRRPGRSAER